MPGGRTRLRATRLSTLLCGRSRRCHRRRGLPGHVRLLGLLHQDLTSGSSSSAAESFSGPGTIRRVDSRGSRRSDHRRPYPLADFGSVTFTDLGLTVPSGSWTLPPYSDAIEMVAPDGSVEALPSPIQGSGASAAFTVTYETPGEMSSTAGTAAVKHPQSTFVAPVPRIAPQHQARQLGGRSIPGPKLGLARIR